MSKLTKRVVDAAMPDPARKVMVWDAELKGFGLRVTPAGVKSYVLSYRTPEGTKRELTIGKHGSPWTCENARERARQVLRDIAGGIDPLAEKTAARQAVTVSDLAEVYLQEGPAARPNKKPRSWETDAALLNSHVLHLLGKKPVKSLGKADVERFQVDVADGKTARPTEAKKGRKKVIGGRGVAARATATLKAMLSFAHARGIIPTNPGSGVKLFSQQKLERFLSVKEVESLAEAINAMEEAGELSAAYAALFRLLLLTGCRRSEIENLQWDWIDFARGLIRFPDSKTGAKVTPLPAAAVEVLKDIAQRNADNYVIAGTRGKWGRISSTPGTWARVRERAGLPGLRLHDLRHTFASFAVADGASLFIVGKVLGHKQASTTEIYAHLQDDPLKAVADRTAGKIAEAMKGGKKPPPKE